MSQAIMRITTVKPADVQWWYEVEPEKAVAMANFFKNFEGITSIQQNSVDANKIITTIVFESAEVIGSYFIQMHAMQEWNSRTVYNEQNNVTQTVSISSE
jgi:hypothetical protein